MHNTHARERGRLETIDANCAYVKAFPNNVKPYACALAAMTCSSSATFATSGRNARTRPAADTHRCNACKYVADVFTVDDQTEQSLCLTAQSRALAFSETTPDAVTLTVSECVLQTIESYVAVHAHSFGRVTRTSPFREEEIRIFATTKCALLPVVTDTPHGPFPLQIEAHARNYIRVIVVTGVVLSRGSPEPMKWIALRRQLR